jgi:subtilase family serine protease
LIGNRSIVGLGSGISSAGSTQATIPANATPGTWYLIARADGAQSVSELIETNNTATTPITIAGPDLQVPALSAPTIAVPGTAITVTDTTKNFGTAPAADSTTFVYLSLDATLDPGDTLIGNRPVAALAAGISSAGSAQATIPANAAPGTWYLIVLADGGQAVAETIETNNKSALAITITLPDLGVSALSAPASAKRGATISVTDTTKNYGTVPAAASTTIYYLSTIKTYDASAIQIGSRNIGMLLKGASSSGSASLTIPAGIATGSYFLIARSDGGEVVAESDEADNTRNATFTVK